MQKGDSVLLRYIGSKQVGTTKKTILHTLQGEEVQIEYKPYFEMLFKVGSSVQGVCTRVDRKTRRCEYDIEMLSFYEYIYEDGITYVFEAKEYIKDPVSLRKYILLTDEYGMEHRLYHPHRNDIKKIGGKIECLVASISAEGLILKSVEAPEMEVEDYQRQQELFDKLHDSRVEDYKVFSKKDFKGVLYDTVNKYPDTAHFIYELLQNADDVKATEVSFILDEKCLLFRHNGTVRFNVSDIDDDDTTGHINSITGISNSTKDDITENKIGKFGVGFKSVFKYTETPHIYDDIFKFKIENFIIPTRLDGDHELREEGETLFEFPFINPDDAYEDIHGKLEELSNATLFLHHLKRIDWSDLTTGETGEFSKSIAKKERTGDILFEKLILRDGSSNTTLWMFSRNIKIPGHGTHPINVGYYLDDDGEINTEIRPEVNCYFPTSETFERCFICHAPFVLVSSRQNLSPTEPVNKMLVTAVVNLAADSLVILRDLGLVHANLFDIIGENVPFYYSYRQDRLIHPKVIYDEYLDRIRNERLLLSRDGDYLLPSELRIAYPKNITEVISREQLQSLTDCGEDGDFLADGFDSTDGIWEKLGVETFSSNYLGTVISEDFMSGQDETWINRFFGFLNDDARNCWVKPGRDATFRTAPILKTKAGRWVSAFNEDILNIYFDGPGAEAYNVVDPSFANLKNVFKFLTDIGCKEPDQEDYIKTQILSKYSPDANLDGDEIDQDFLTIYRYAQKIPHERYDDFISLLKEKYYLTFDKDALHVEFRLPSEGFIDSPMILEYFGKGRKYPIVFSDNYQDSIDAIGRVEFENFLIQLGCKTHPGVLQPDRSAWQLSGWQHMALGDRNKHCTNIYLYDKDIEGLSDCISRGELSRKLSKQIWKWLIEIGPENFKEMKADLYYRTHDYRYCESSILEFLRITPWLYDTDGELCIPSNVAKEDLLANQYEYNSQLFTLLNIKSKEFDIVAHGGTDEDKNMYLLGKAMMEQGITVEDAADFAKFKEEKNRKEKAEREQRESKEKKAEDFLTRDELSSTGADAFAGYDTSTFEKNKETAAPQKTAEERRTEQEQQWQERRDKELSELEKDFAADELRESVDSMQKYSKEWFDALLKLEYGEDQKQNNGGTRAISISFGSVVKEKGSEKIFILKSPSKCPIPIEIEQLGGIEVLFSFRSREGFTKGFEVASVKDFTLRLKAKQADMEFLNGIDWSDCTKAEINVNNPSQLMGKLINAFQALGKPEGYDFKAHLRNNLSFVFGPPGTGKTTYLAKKVRDIMEDEYMCKILILSPTNKACDVITKKIHEVEPSSYWLGRFVATADEEVENLGLVWNRDSDLYEENKCCVVSTIARLPYDGFSGSSSHMRLTEIPWDYIIIDEASMIPLAQITYAIYRFPNAEFIIAGDPKQLAPIVHEKKWKDENIYTMVKLDRFDNPTTEPHDFPVVNLETQYRSIPAIGRIFSEYAYAGKLKHYRSNDEQIKLEFKGLELKPINLIPFKVSRYDDIFGPKKLSGSNVQVYSVLLVIEMCKALAKEYSKKKHTHILTVGVICPYVAEAQMIEKLIEQIRDIPNNVDINVGTINGFQGDECDVIFTVFNPPTALASCTSDDQAEKLFVNDRRLVNVAASRAKDYLFILIPHKETKGWPWMKEVIRLGKIIIQDSKAYSSHTSDEIEKILFGKPFYIENNSFYTTHQMANVYTQAAQKYEVRIDDNSVDIQIEQN